MATFENLEIDKFYLIKVKDEDEITMVQVGMTTDRCVLVYIFNDEFETSYWKKKEDFIAEIVEELTDEHVDAYEMLLEEDMDDNEDDFIAENYNGQDFENEFALTDINDDHGKKKKKKKKK